VVYPTKTPFFADALWVDAWPAATDLPTTNLLTATSSPEEASRRSRFHGMGARARSDTELEDLYRRVNSSFVTIMSRLYDWRTFGIFTGIKLQRQPNSWIGPSGSGQ